MAAALRQDPELLRGLPGVPGPQGPQGIQGVPGRDGANGANGADGTATLAWPLGSVYLTVANRNPVQILGFGTWETMPAVAVGIFTWKRTA